MPNDTVPAAATGLPCQIIPFPWVTRSAEPKIGFVDPVRTRWSVAHDTMMRANVCAEAETDADLDRRVVELLRGNRVVGMQVIRENSEAMQFLADVLGFLDESNRRFVASLDRVASAGVVW